VNVTVRDVFGVNKLSKPVGGVRANTTNSVVPTHLVAKSVDERLETSAKALIPIVEPERQAEVENVAKTVVDCGVEEDGLHTKPRHTD